MYDKVISKYTTHVDLQTSCRLWGDIIYLDDEDQAHAAAGKNSVRKGIARLTVARN